MTHISEDALVVFALDTTAETAERPEIAAHLAACGECRGRLASIRHDVDLLGSIRIPGRTLPMPVGRRPVRLWALLQAAALLAIGFALGLGTADRARREPACVSPAYLDAVPPPESVRLCAVPDATAPGAWGEVHTGR